MEDNLVPHEDHAVTDSKVTSNMQSLWIDKIVLFIIFEMHEAISAVMDLQKNSCSGL